MIYFSVVLQLVINVLSFIKIYTQHCGEGCKGLILVNNMYIVIVCVSVINTFFLSAYPNYFFSILFWGNCK